MLTAEEMLAQIVKMRRDAENPVRAGSTNMPAVTGWLRGLHIGCVIGRDVAQDMNQDQIAVLLGEYPRGHERQFKVRSMGDVSVEEGVRRLRAGISRVIEVHCSNRGETGRDIARKLNEVLEGTYPPKMQLEGSVFGFQFESEEASPPTLEPEERSIMILSSALPPPFSPWQICWTEQIEKPKSFGGRSCYNLFGAGDTKLAKDLHPRLVRWLVEEAQIATLCPEE
jgi:hypothetical protein